MHMTLTANDLLLATPAYVPLSFLSHRPGDTVLKFKCFFSIDAAGRRA